MDIKSNNNVTCSCSYHVVFCPNYRRKVLAPPIDRRLKQIIKDMCDEVNADLMEMEVMPDHVHLLVGCDPRFGINRLVGSKRGRSARTLRDEFPALKSRLPSLWTSRYFVAAVGRRRST